MRNLTFFVVILIVGTVTLGGCDRTTQPYGGESDKETGAQYDYKFDRNAPTSR